MLYILGCFLRNTYNYSKGCLYGKWTLQQKTKKENTLLRKRVQGTGNQGQGTDFLRALRT